MPEDYQVHTEIPLKFSNHQQAAASAQVTVEKANAQEKGWMVTLLSRQVIS